MANKLIERAVSVASEHVKWAGWEQWAELSLVELVTRCVDIIDAERGKEAVAWVEVIDRHEGPYNFQGKELLDSGKHDLFLSPTISEGMALVPIEPTEAMLNSCHRIDLSYMPGQEKADRAAIYRAMLAAAQGERND